MRKFIIVTAIFLSTGCATLGMLADEARQIKQEEVAPQIESVGILIEDLVPAPYRIPASIGLGYLLALIRRIYKRKKGSTA